jgi:hypothetical protein
VLQEQQGFYQIGTQFFNRAMNYLNQQQPAREERNEDTQPLNDPYDSNFDSLFNLDPKKSF